MTTPVFSIIIPVYNVEKYIATCLDSIFNQDFDECNYEVIVVNDGTPDNSMSIVESYARCHANIVIINKENGGVSSARNVGIQVAKGEYLIFVDSDDAIEVDSLKEVLLSLDKEVVDVLILNSYTIENDTKNNVAVYPYPQNLKGKTITGVELFQKGYLAKGSVWGAAYRRAFFLEFHLEFPESVINGEDTLFMAVALCLSSKVKQLDIDFYHIFIRPDSASQSWNYERLRVMFNSFSAIKDYIEKYSFTRDQMEILHFHIYITISNTLHQFFSIHRLNKYFEVRHAIVKSGYYPIKTGKLRQCKEKIRLLNFSYDLYCLPFFIRQLLKDVFK